MVQGSRREYPLGLAARLKGSGNLVIESLETAVNDSNYPVPRINSLYSTFQPLTSTVALAAPNSLAR